MNIYVQGLYWYTVTVTILCKYIPFPSTYQALIPFPSEYVSMTSIIMFTSVLFVLCRDHEMRKGDLI